MHNMGQKLPICILNGISEEPLIFFYIFAIRNIFYCGPLPSKSLFHLSTRRPYHNCGDTLCVFFYFSPQKHHVHIHHYIKMRVLWLIRCKNRIVICKKKLLSCCRHMVLWMRVSEYKATLSGRRFEDTQVFLRFDDKWTRAIGQNRVFVNIVLWTMFKKSAVGALCATDPCARTIATNTP